MLAYPELLARLTAVLQDGGASLALLLVNVMDLPAVQARLGFARCAQLLQQLADAFKVALGERGRVLRLGDGSFCVLVRGVRNAGHALLAGQKLKQAIEQVMDVAGLAIAPQLRMGLALFPEHARDAVTLLRKAQLAASADRPRDLPMQVYDASCEQVLTPWTLADSFARALREGSLQVHFQPKICIANGQTTGVEALLRWLQDDTPVSTPQVFVPLAEEAGLAEEMTWFVLSNALRQAATFGNLEVAVNITPGMLHHRDFLEMVSTALDSWGLKRGGLTLEITEGALIVDFEQAMLRLRKLRDCGVRISIDDFGTGYSSLSYFRRITADEIKVDKSFIMRMGAHEADRRLVDVIVSLAHQFQMKVVAEGVEDRATFTALTGIGCDYAQGFLFTPALPAEALRIWLAEQDNRRGP